MITMSLNRNAPCYWKRGNSFYECSFQEMYPKMPNGKVPVKVIKAQEEYILSAEEIYPSYKSMFLEKHHGILSLWRKGERNRAEISRSLGVPYSRVLNVIYEALENQWIYE